MRPDPAKFRILEKERRQSLFIRNKMTIFTKLRRLTVDLGFENMDLRGIEDLCQKLHVPYTIVKAEIGKIIFEDRKEANPCSLCAKMRKGALNQAVKEAGCNKVAYAHHKDDVVETMLMSLIFEGRFHTFSPLKTKPAPLVP